MSTSQGRKAPHLPEYDLEEYTEEKLTPVGLTPKQQQQWDDTMSLMAWTAPGFRHLFFKLLANHKNSGKYAALPTPGVPIAATDGRHILINPDRFFSEFDMRERVFILGHEVMHNVYNDVPFINRCRQSGTVPMDDGTTLPYDETAMQHAADYRINALLEESHIGKPPKIALLDKNIATANSGLVETYKKVYDDYEKNGKLGGQGFDVVLIPNSTPQNQQQWQVEVKTAQMLEQMKTQGRGMAGCLQRMFEQVLNPQVPWTEKIRGIFNRKVGSGGYNWRKPDRRHITRDLYMPSRSGNGAGHIVCWADNSGSISDTDMCHYLAELANIVEDCRPKRLTVIWCDDWVQRVDEISEPSDMATLQYEAAKDGINGGGGTSCEPVFEWMQKELDEEPEVFIGFTDGYVTFPPRPAYPNMVVIWASVAKAPEEYPYGDVVEINSRSLD